ncbi:MAG TPA: radical SAM protein [Thermoanaerobaculia bacterium]|nr:radical SAM protein [Thermoanaerobaculia bacterium]HQN07097.1 radical SAM protein [Thermoanaerobaculia bacterium]HQP86339.1 radical SAM protein [Thermoanaerobaculia bacterium]
MTRIDDRAVRPLVPGPRAVTLLLTTRCNLSCAYCPQRRGAPREMDAAALEAAVRLVATSGHARPKLVLFGGEPLLAKALVRRVLALLAASARPGLAPDVHVVTNGLLLDAETAASLDEAGVTIELSCDGFDAAQERRGAGTGADLRSVFLLLARSRPRLLAERLVARVTVDSGNVGALGRSVAELRAAGIREIRAAPVQTPDPGWSEASADLLDRALSEIAALPPNGNGDSTFDPLRPSAGPRNPFGVAACSLGEADVLFVDVDGRIAPCGAFAPSVLPSLPPLAEELRQRLVGLRVDDPALDTRLALRAAGRQSLPALVASAARRSPRGPCASCEALDECAVCPAAIAGAPEQDPDLVPAIWCDWNRRTARHRRASLRSAVDDQRAGSSSSAPETSAVTAVRIAGA